MADSARTLKRKSLAQKNRIKNGYKPWLNFVGEKSWLWKGDKVGYRALHAWVQRKLGSPQFCEDCKRTKPPKGKGKKRSYFQWANISGKYKRIVSDWKRLCYKCHRIFDKQYGKRKHHP